MSEKRKRGRPAKKDSELRRGCQVYFTEAQHKAITRAAAKAGSRYRTHWLEDLAIAKLKELGEIS